LAPHCGVVVAEAAPLLQPARPAGTTLATVPTIDLDPSRAASPSGLRVLVVEDDPAALALMLETMQVLGHWAAGVSSAEVAKTRYFDGAFDVLVADVGLPALSGVDLARGLLARHAGLKVIFVTGYPAPAEPIPGTLWIQKPFTLEQLGAALDAVAAELPSRPTAPAPAWPAR